MFFASARQRVHQVDAREVGHHPQITRRRSEHRIAQREVHQFRAVAEIIVIEQVAKERLLSCERTSVAVRGSVFVAGQLGIDVRLLDLEKPTGCVQDAAEVAENIGRQQTVSLLRIDWRGVRARVERCTGPATWARCLKSRGERAIPAALSNTRPVSESRRRKKRLFSTCLTRRKTFWTA